MNARKEENSVRVRIDMNRFIANTKLAGVRLLEAEAEEYLAGWGFKQLGSRLWSCSPDHLDLLHNDEICNVRPAAGWEPSRQ